jgi:hypothetical protein
MRELGCTGQRKWCRSNKILKIAGFSNRQIARYVGLTGLDGEARVRDQRKGTRGLPCVKRIDTLAAEFPAQTNYLYMTYSGDEDDPNKAPRGNLEAILPLLAN